MQCEFVNIGKKNSLLKIENEHFHIPAVVIKKWIYRSFTTICCRSPEKSHENISRRTSQGDIPVDSRVRVTIKRPRVSPPCPDGERSGVIGSMDMPIPRGAEGVMEWQILAKRSNLHLSHLNMEEKRKTWMGKHYNDRSDWPRKIAIMWNIEDIKMCVR